MNETVIWLRDNNEFDHCDCGAEFGSAERNEWRYCPMCGGEIRRVGPRNYLPEEDGLRAAPTSEGE
jgi:hypothetical protein